jgi:hypothetical protein
MPPAENYGYLKAEKGFVIPAQANSFVWPKLIKIE